MEIISQNKVHGGWLKRYQHHSDVLNCDMTFTLFLPPQAEEQAVPVLYWLSGLECTDENFMQKAGAQRLAAELGMAIVCPDTSPRGTNLPGEHDSWDLGSSAGFYVDATEQPWESHYKMYSYVTKELPELITESFPVTDRKAISGHSMGGHGALICALKNPKAYSSVSAFAPISHPSDCPWGQKAFSHYLGNNKDNWAQFDACDLVAKSSSPIPILVDQGSADKFLSEQLKPEALTKACKDNDFALTLRMQPGYDHSYFFITSFIEDHLRYHGKALGLL
ncbi:S-formylglutathione hydrolase [Endozoicomonas sp. SM1973]|uniref:S-formylglutathione hydrolase n=1 Tax=Spartinivicinus marinus TaxID=2994442 RepID=A0A853I314_9GAMM|nr:S-formylglutathione hydrolase [Spartinivicinus marinus]NYZ64594.1 S-formylglutathione hydrolase [Spartinivicinus marinus]